MSEPSSRPGLVKWKVSARMATLIRQLEAEEFQKLARGFPPGWNRIKLVLKPRPTTMEASEGVEDSKGMLPSTETDAAPSNANEGESKPPMTEEQWAGIKELLERVYNYRDEEGNDPAKAFRKRVNSRNHPDYYTQIAEPVALSNIKESHANHRYTTFAEFVRDCALIWHNAHSYNLPSAGVYHAATMVKGIMEEELQKLVDRDVATAEQIQWPDLGEVPAEEVGAEEEEQEDEEDDDDEDEEGDESEDEDAPKKKRASRPKGRKTGDGVGEPVGQKRRGRPPKIATPLEARMRNVMKGLRRAKDEQDNQRIRHFEKLPDKAAMPEYYSAIKKPMAVELIKKNMKRKRYKTFQALLDDVDLMFDNAMQYNEDDSDIFVDANALKTHARKLAETEKNKPDTDPSLGDGRDARPDGIVLNGEHWKIGDWVLISNPNDVTKPIIAHINELWVDQEGREWTSACWYYRPEQTIHQHEKHFWPMEVVKTSQYRDHALDEVTGRCYVQFHTRYARGRPKGLPSDTEVYVCEARYNETTLQFNKIKTWLNCIPDSVRDKTYEIDEFPDGIRKVRKQPSPLLHMLKDESKETTEIPKARWGVNNAPPIVGGIYKGARPENQSPPPSPPPPTPPPAPARPISNVPPTPTQDYTYAKAPAAVANDDTSRANAMPAHQPIRPSSRPSYPAQLASQPSHSVSPGPHQQRPTGHHYGAAYTPGSTHHAPIAAAPRAAHDQSGYERSRLHAQQAASFGAAQPTPGRFGPAGAGSGTPPAAAPTPPAAAAVTPAPTVLQPGQRASEVYVLPPAANTAIPEDIRARFRRDEQGNVLWFSKAPVYYDAKAYPPDPAAPLGHSIRYRAAMIRRRLFRDKKAEEAARAGPANGGAQAANSGATDASVAMDVDRAAGPTSAPTAAAPAPTAPPAPPAPSPFPPSEPDDPPPPGVTQAQWDMTNHTFRSLNGAADWKAVRDAELRRHTELLRRHLDDMNPALRAARERKRRGDEIEAIFRPPKVYKDDIDPRL